VEEGRVPRHSIAPTSSEFPALLRFSGEGPPTIPNDVHMAEVVVRRNPQVGEEGSQVDLGVGVEDVVVGGVKVAARFVPGRSGVDANFRSQRSRFCDVLL
jgi:hypothetical protein